MRPPSDVILKAAAEAVAAQAAVEAVSRARADSLLKAPAVQRLGALDHPDLLPADRARVRRSLQAGLHRSVHERVVPRRRLALIRRGFTSQRGPVLGLMIGVALLAVAYGRSAVPATLTAPTPVTLLRPNGTQISGTLPANTALLIQHLNEISARAREWRSREGYLTFTVPIANVRFARP